MRSAETLRGILRRIDGRGYRTYREIEGSFGFPSFVLHVDSVQGDPFAAPSKLRLRVPMETAAIPRELFSGRVRRIALEDRLAREVRDAIREQKEGGPGDRDDAADRTRGGGSGKSGLVSIDAGGQAVLERTAIRLTGEFVEARIEVGLPAAGRRVLGRGAEALLCEALERLVRRALLYENLPAADLRRFVECIENQEHVRARLRELGLLAFVGDGSILPRESGASDRPMAGAHARPFFSPDSHRLMLSLPNPRHDSTAATDEARRSLSGMGLREGVNLIVGGGYHGKSTLLRALECGVHPHVPGDGREWVVAREDLVAIRAEDGRAVRCVDIDGFISGVPALRPLPGGGTPEVRRRSTAAFSSDDASGSTSQAAGIVEAIEAGSRALLLDEDTSASNFMLRDARMQRLVQREDEPITPFVDCVRELYECLGVSSVIVMGGSGDYFDVADSVIMMREFEPLDATARARHIAAELPSARSEEPRHPLGPVTPRFPAARSFDPSRGRKAVKLSARSREQILYGSESIDLRSLSQLMETSQTRAIAHCMHLASRHFMATEPGPDTPEEHRLSAILDALDALLDDAGLDALDPFGPSQRPGRGEQRHPGNLARPRRYEVAAAINRMRSLEVWQARSEED